MIKSFRHKGLKEVFETGKSKAIAADQAKRIQRCLDLLHAATKPADMNVPGFNFHSLHRNPIGYSIWVAEQWRITFCWEDDGATNVDLEQYH